VENIAELSHLLAEMRSSAAEQDGGDADLQILGGDGGVSTERQSALTRW
jgi:hypothetical protein